MRDTSLPMKYEFEPWLDSDEVAKLMGVHPETVKRRARTGEIPGIKIGKLWRFRASALELYVRKMMEESGRNLTESSYLTTIRGNRP
jgi:excisionase family DNA binding protein